MQLNNGQILSAANGTVRSETNDKGLELHRFTREQEAFFYKTHPLFCHEYFFNGYFGHIIRTTGGITLDFSTDAEKLVFNFGTIEFPCGATKGLFDLYIDGSFEKSYEAAEIGDKIEYETAGGLHRYTLYLPIYLFPIISSVELVGANEFVPHKKDAEILFLGDSITHGGIAEHPSNSYVMRVFRALNVGIINQGVSGFVYDAESVEKVCDPKIVVTAYGINDYGRKDADTLEKSAKEFIIKTRRTYPDAKIVSVLPLWTAWDEDENFKRLERERLKKVFDSYSDVTVDGHDLIPHDKKYLQDGLVHPNDEGFSFYGERLAIILKKFLNKH